MISAIEWLALLTLIPTVLIAWGNLLGGLLLLLSALAGR